MSRLLLMMCATAVLLAGCSQGTVPTSTNPSIPTYRILDFEASIKPPDASADSSALQVKGRCRYSIKPAPLLGKTVHHLYDVALITETTVSYLDGSDNIVEVVRTRTVSSERINLTGSASINIIQRHTVEERHTMYLGFVLTEMELRFSRAWIGEPTQ
jgi:hypothetical protein